MIGAATHSAKASGALKLGPGVLYGSISKLLAMGFIEESADRPDRIWMTSAAAITALLLEAVRPYSQKRLGCANWRG